MDSTVRYDELQWAVSSSIFKGATALNPIDLTLRTLFIKNAHFISFGYELQKLQTIRNCSIKAVIISI